MAGENEGSTPEVAVSPRAAMMAAVIASDLKNKEDEIRDGGGTPVAAADLLQPGEELPPLERPEAVSEEDWENLSLEGKAEAVRNAQTAAPKTATTGETAGAGETTTTPTGTTEETTSATSAATATGEESGTTTGAAPSGRTIKITVDGQDIEVPEEEIIAAGIKARQQDTAADRRLEDARRAREAGERLLAEARELKETLGTAPNQGAAPAAGDDADIDAIAHALQYGSKDEAKAALVKLKGIGHLTDQQIAAQIDARIAFQDGVNFYRTEFKEIATDPDLHAFFLMKEKAARDAGDRRPYRELYTELGNQLVERFKLRANATPNPAPADQLAAKREAKRQSTPQPTSASVRQPAPTEQREPTESEARASGLSQLQRMRPGAR